MHLTDGSNLARALLMMSNSLVLEGCCLNVGHMRGAPSKQVLRRTARQAARPPRKTVERMVRRVAVTGKQAYDLVYERV